MKRVMDENKRKMREMEAQQQCSGVRIELGNEVGWLADLPGDFDAYSCKQSYGFMYEK